MTSESKQPQIIDLSKLGLEQLTALKNQLDQVSKAFDCVIFSMEPNHRLNGIRLTSLLNYCPP